MERVQQVLSPLRVPVTDGQERASLAVTRALGEADAVVIVGAENVHSLASASRFCRGEWEYPSPLRNQANFIDSIKQAIKQWQISHVIAVTDSTIQALSEKKADFGSVGYTLPPWDAYNLVSDKYRLMQLAKQLDVPIPDTVFVPDGNAAAVVERIAQFPVVVKPGRSLLKMEGQWTKTSVHFASNAGELIQLYRETPYLRHPSLIQRRISGPGEGVFGLFDHGNPSLLFAHRRIREKPPAGGVSVLRESIALPQSMKDSALKLMKHVQWQGVAMVEFKVDSDSGVPMLIEINGRFWGSLQLAMDAGLNFPDLLCRAASGGSFSLPDNSYRIGVKSRWFLGDVDHLLLRLTKSSSELCLGSSHPSKGRCILDFCKFFQRNLYYEIERPNDLGPAYCEYRDWFRHFFRKGR